jgi:hypothetical protein
MKKTALHLLAVIALCTPAAAQAAAQAAAPAAAPAAALAAEIIPDADLRVTVQQKADGKITNGFHVFELTCRNGNCSLTAVTLNQCGDVGSGKQAFNPKVQFSSTATGNLKVRNEGKTIVVQETGSDMIGNYVTDLRFDYEPLPDSDKPVTRLTGFSGGYVKNAPGLKMVFKLDYVPLPKASQFMKLDCDAIVPGINKK